MGRLAGLRYRDVVRRLRRFGFEFERHGAGSHEVWIDRSTGSRLVIASHPGDIAEGTVRAILKQAGIAVDDFLA